MGISRSSKNKRRLTGGRMPIHRKKRKFEMGRQASMTKLGEKKVINVRGRGGNIKRRALKLNEGNFTWISEQVTKKCKIVEVIYNASSDLFEVRLLNTDGSIKEQTSDVYLDCLVNVIDGMVERCPDYQKRVNEEYGLTIHK